MTGCDVCRHHSTTSTRSFYYMTTNMHEIVLHMDLLLCVCLTCMHWLLLSATTTLPLLEAEIPCRLVNSPFSLPREPEGKMVTHLLNVPFDIFTVIVVCNIIPVG